MTIELNINGIDIVPEEINLLHLNSKTITISTGSDSRRNWEFPDKEEAQKAFNLLSAALEAVEPD